jgi:hypothetical protein
MTGRVQDWNRQSMKKDGSTPKHGVRSMDSLFHSNAPVMLADGGKVDEAAMKQRGLAESNKEKPMGLFERLRMGNIDQAGSEAYNRFGAGRGRMEGELDKAESEMKANQANARTGDAAMRQRKVDDVDFAKADELQATGRAVAGKPAPEPARRKVSRVEAPAAVSAANRKAADDADFAKADELQATARAVAGTPAKQSSPAPKAKPFVPTLTQRKKPDTAPARPKMDPRRDVAGMRGNIRQKMIDGEELTPNEEAFAKRNNMI